GPLEGICRTYRATILLSAGDARAAAAEARAAVDIPALSPPMRAYPLGVLARAMLAEGKVEEALSAAETAVALLRRWGRVGGGEARRRCGSGTSRRCSRPGARTPRRRPSRRRGIGCARTPRGSPIPYGVRAS